jgi:hypothetical protein
MKHALIAITAVLSLSACRDKTTATSAAQGTPPASSSKATRTSPDGRMKAPGKGAAQSAGLVENERGGDPKKSALLVKIHP